MPKRIVVYICEYKNSHYYNIYHLREDCRMISIKRPARLVKKQLDLAKHSHRKYRPCFVCAIQP